ncbi:hypothetical protein ABN702_22680 [Bacillus haimaensis]|uniref:hypothetical protein n=1 Tax=Bacillus haimaensis TaxID=3160967 RepID=UPI003AA84D9A
MSLYFEWIKSSGSYVPYGCKEPRLYFDQIKEPLHVPLDSLVEILMLEVTIDSAKERVWLDSKVNLKMETGISSEYSILCEFSLWRNSTLLATEKFALTNQIGKEGKVKTLMISVGISCTDDLLPPGNYTYTLKVRRLEDVEENVSNFEVKDRGLNAVVFLQ